MSTAIVALGIAVSWLGVAVVLLMVTHARERDSWIEERRALVDRIIAQHTGEVIALDRQAARTKNGSPTPAPERPHPVGL